MIRCRSSTAETSVARTEKKAKLLRATQQAIPILVAGIAGALTPAITTWTGSLTTGLLVPILAVLIPTSLLLGREVLLYLLALTWILPVTTAGTDVVPLARHLSAWELLLYAAFAGSLASGHIRFGTRLYNSRMSPPFISGVWIGLVLVLLGSLLAAGRTTPLGHANFRYAGVVPLALFLLTLSLVDSPKVLTRLALLLLTSTVGVLVVQLGLGFATDHGRLTIQIAAPFGIREIGRANRLAIWLNSLMPLALSLALASRAYLVRLSSLFLYGALGSALFLTLSRGNLLAALAGSLVVIYHGIRIKRRDGLLSALPMAIIVILASLGYLANWFQGLDDYSHGSVIDRASSFASLSAISEGLASRIDLWRLSAQMFADTPFGSGYGTLVDITGSWEHNIFVLIANGGGVIGLIGLVVFLASYASACLRALKTAHVSTRWVSVAALGGLLTFVLNGMTTEVLYPGYAEPALLALALGLAATKFQSHGSRHGPQARRLSTALPRPRPERARQMWASSMGGSRQ